MRNWCPLSGIARAGRRGWRRRCDRLSFVREAQGRRNTGAGLWIGADTNLDNNGGPGRHAANLTTGRWPICRYGYRKHARRVRHLHHHIPGAGGLHLPAPAQRARSAHRPRAAAVQPYARANRRGRRRKKSSLCPNRTPEAAAPKPAEPVAPGERWKASPRPAPRSPPSSTRCRRRCQFRSSAFSHRRARGLRDDRRTPSRKAIAAP